MTVTIAALREHSNFSDTDLRGFTQIDGFNNIINIFRPEHPTTNPKTHPLELPA